MGLQERYTNDEDFRQHCGMLDALAFVPDHLVAEGLQILRDSAPEGMGDLFDYFDATYVGGTFRAVTVDDEELVTRMRRRRPNFPPPVWNVLQATLNDTGRTNNASEAWNGSFKKLVGQAHPSIWKLIECLQDDNAVASTTLLQMALGDPPTKRLRRETVRLQQRLKFLCEEYLRHQDLVTHLQAVGSCIRF